MDLQFAVDGELCTRCGQCVLDCPTLIIHQSGDAVPAIPADEAGDCMECQHCLAVCPTGALSILGRNPADSLELTTDALPSLDEMTRLVRGRRTVRQYADTDVDPALLATILAAMANAPSGVNRRELTIHVIDRREVMVGIKKTVMDTLADLVAMGGIPGETGLGRYLRIYNETGRDVIFRGAPHALIVTAPTSAPCPQEDVTLSLAYFELMAQSAGLGTVWWGLIKWVLETQPILKPLFGIEPDTVYYAMLFGNPLVRYARTVQRDDGAAVKYIR